MENIYDGLLGGGQWVSKSKIDSRLYETDIVDGILSNPGETRTREQIELCCSIGLIGELAVASKLGGILNPQEFDLADRHSYGWDVLDTRHDLKLEIKNHGKKWFDYAKKDLQVLFRNIESGCMDYIITTKVVQLKEEVPGFQVWPRLVINPKTFRHYLHDSKTDSTKQYYNHYHAMAAGECFEFNEHLECNTVYKPAQPWYNSNNDKFAKAQ